MALLKILALGNRQIELVTVADAFKKLSGGTLWDDQPFGLFD